MSELVSEIQRRQTNTDKVLALFKARPKEWIDAHVLMQHGGAMAWRTRVSDARKIIEGEGGVLENRQRVLHGDEVFEGQKVISEYRYLLWTPSGHDAAEPRERLLFDTHPRG